MSIIEWKKEETIAVIQMNNGENAHNLEFAKFLHQVLSEVEEDSSVSAVVLTSADSKFFSIGADVEWVLSNMHDDGKENIKEFMNTMNAVFKKLLLFPVPVIAAINGHAFGNGAILSCACDFRFMRSDKGYFCFPEVDVGIPFLPGMLAFVKKAVPYDIFYEIYLSGRRLAADEMEKNKIIQKACSSQEDLMKTCLEFAQTFKKRRGIFSEHKRRIHKSIISIMDTEDGEYIEAVNLFVKD